jgi:dedicator of cytokinesis protein 3
LSKVDLPTDQLRDCHLFFTFRNRKERSSSSNGLGGSAADKPFAFGYLPLFGGDDSCVPDGMHELVLYRYDPQWCTPVTYYDVPSTSQDQEAASQDTATMKMLIPLRDSFSVRTFLCSTQLTQDPTLLKILNWETKIPNDVDALKNEFNRLKYCPEYECIKMFRHIFDSIFAILASPRNEQGEIDGLAFSVLVTLLCGSPFDPEIVMAWLMSCHLLSALVNDRRFENFRPVLDVYISRHFSSSTAFSHIIKSLHYLVEHYEQAELAQDLRASIKVWPYLFKFIVSSRKMQRAKEEHMNVTANHIEKSFKRDLKNLLSAINVMMAASTPPSVIGTQGRWHRHDSLEATVDISRLQV